MSRKANNLRKRLRIEQQRRDVRAARLIQDVEREKSKLEAFKRQLTLPQSVMVRVEQEWGRGHGDLWGVAITFAPDQYVRMIFRESRGHAQNLDYMAQMIGEEIGQKVSRAIIDRLQAAGGPAVQAMR